MHIAGCTGRGDVRGPVDDARAGTGGAVVTRARAVRVTAVLAGALALVALLAGPAFAHAQLVGTDPAPGQVLTKRPSAITLRFSENVQVTANAIRLYDSGGNVLVTGKPSSPAVGTVRVPIGSDLKNGAYIVTWRVVSADTHPVQGSFTFQIGSGSNATSRDVLNLAGKLLSKRGGDQAVGALYGASRWLWFAGFATLVGAAVFLGAIRQSERGSARARRLLWGGWWATVIATVGGALVYGPYAASLPLSNTFNSTVLSDLLDERLAHVGMARLGLLLLTVPLLVALTRADRPLPRWWVPAGAVVGLGLSLTPALAGHASTADLVPWAVLADTVHVGAMAVWLGGLLTLAICVFPGRGVNELGGVVQRFSRVALGCVLLIVATGAFATWRQVRTLDALRTTDYGRMLIVKLVLFAVVIAFATLSREICYRLWVRPYVTPHPRIPVVAGGADDAPSGDVAVEPARRFAWWRRRYDDTLADDSGTGRDGGDAGFGDDSDDEFDDDEIDEEIEVRNLKRAVWAEAVIGLAILVVTALLVNAVPARTAALQNTAGAAVLTLKSSKVWADVTIVPARRGANEVHLDTLRPGAGLPFEPLETKATVDFPDKKLPPQELQLLRLGPGHWIASGVELPFAGQWRITIRARTSQIDESTLVGRFAVNGTP